MHEVASDPDQVVALDAALEVVLLQFQSLKVHDVGLGGAAPRTRKCQRAQQPGAADKGSGSGSSSSAAELGSGSSRRGAAERREQGSRMPNSPGNVAPDAPRQEALAHFHPTVR